MAYIVGVSSGMFMTAEAAEKQQYVTMPQKMFYGAFKGVNFVQVDLESITEFIEPYLEEGIRRIKELGLRFALHGESYAMGGTERPISMLDSAIETEYLHSHQRLIQHIKGGGKIGAEYINIHPSETTPFIRLNMHLQPAMLVDPWGRRFNEFLKDNPRVLEWAVNQNFIVEARHVGYSVSSILREKYDAYKRQHNKEPTEEEWEKMSFEAKKEGLMSYLVSNDLEYGAERYAYFMIAKWMQMEGHPLWKNIVGRNIPDDQLEALSKEGPGKSWVPAVSSLYISGHFNPKDPRFEDPKRPLERYKMYFIFETQMGGGGIEGMNRLVRPRDMVFLCQNIRSKWVGVCFDFEHVLAQNVDPKKEIESFPGNAGEWVKVCHLGFPTPHAPAHIPLLLGSREQYYLYERLFELRQKGFKNGFLIFERGGGKDPVEQSTVAIKMIQEHLEKNIRPKELPEMFFGIPPGGPRIRRQEVIVREHFFDPLKGMLAIPEEEYTFLSKAATEKGKAKEWEKEELR